MSTTLHAIALIAAALALAVAGYVAVEARSGSANLEARLASLEAQISQLERKRDASPREPVLVGTGGRVSIGPSEASGRTAPAAGGSAMGETAPAAGGPPVRVGAEVTEELQELVAEAVEKKAAEYHVMQTTKKPPIDLFAETLELTDDQRYVAEREIVGAQREIKGILEIPAADGTNFVDELVEVFAQGIAHPGENPGRGMLFFGRLLTEQVPGSNETYAVRIESVKERLRSTFRREWTDKQYATFEAWKMDPTEVEDIEGSPWKEVETLVIERAKALGADIPDPPRAE